MLIMCVLSYSEMSMSQYMASDGAEHAKPAYPSLGLGNSFSFKFKDREGHVHRFNMGKFVKLAWQPCDKNRVKFFFDPITRIFSNFNFGPKLLEKRKRCRFMPCECPILAL